MPKYITGLTALNLYSPDDPTPGDWHWSSVNWHNPWLRDTADSPFGDWGLYKGEVPENGEMWIANHVRACLDLIESGNSYFAAGMREDFICDEDFTPVIFNKVWELRDKDNWAAIDDFMCKEYLCDWLDFKKDKGFPIEPVYNQYHIPYQGDMPISDYLIERINDFIKVGRIQDLYEVCRICTVQLDEVEPEALRRVQGALLYDTRKNLEYVLATQYDPGIDPDTLRTMFSQTFENLGIAL